jgi:hypothetical protein
LNEQWKSWYDPGKSEKNYSSHVWMGQQYPHVISYPKEKKTRRKKSTAVELMGLIRSWFQAFCNHSKIQCRSVLSFSIWPKVGCSWWAMWSSHSCKRHLKAARIGVVGRLCNHSCLKRSPISTCEQLVKSQTWGWQIFIPGEWMCKHMCWTLDHH